MIAFGGLSWALEDPRHRSQRSCVSKPRWRPAGRLRRDTAGEGCPRARSAFMISRSPIPVRRDGARGLRPHDSRRFVTRHRRAERRRQDDAREAVVPALRPAVGRDRGGRSGRTGNRYRVVALAGRRRLPGFHPARASAARQRRAGGAPDEVVRAALDVGGADEPGHASTRCSRAATKAAPICRAASGSASRSHAPLRREDGRGVVLLDEPTAQLDVRGEAEIFDRILAATRHCTTILISHRFSTVRHADRICVLEHGRVVELGTHDELMAHNGRYRTMFELQAQRFTTEEEEGTTYDVLA